VARATSNGVDGQLPPALNVRKPTSGKHQQAKLALSRAEAKASEPSVIVAVEKEKKKDRISNIPRKLPKKSIHNLTLDTLSSTQHTVQG